MAAGAADRRCSGGSLRKARLMSFQMSSMDLIEFDEVVGRGESGEKGRGDDEEIPLLLSALLLLALVFLFRHGADHMVEMVGGRR